jgi:hypothetical protein
LLAPVALLGVLFVLAGEVAATVVLACMLTVAIASRATILERNLAGSYARTRGWLELTRACALLVVYGVIVFFSSSPVTNTGLATAAALSPSGRLAVSRSISSETSVGSVTARATGCWAATWNVRWREFSSRCEEKAGWITHNIKKDRGGNVDHFLSGPSGAFAIETKRGSERAADRNQAIWNAVWAKEKFGLRWVTAILCVGTAAPPLPVKKGYVWVLGLDDLVEFLRQPR